MQRNLQKRRTTASKEINKNSMPFIRHNKNDIKEKTMIEKKLYNRIEESFEKLDEQNEEEENDDEKKNEDEIKNEDESKNEDEDENENDNQNKKETTEKEK